MILTMVILTYYVTSITYIQLNNNNIMNTNNKKKKNIL